MGLFSSSKKTYVASTTINVIDNPGNPEKSAVLHSILNQNNLTDDLLTTYTHGMHLKFNAAYLYAQNHYTYGLPQGTLDRGMGDQDAVRTVLETLNGTAVAIEYCVLATDCDDDFAYPFLYASRGWNPDTGVVTVHPFVTTTAPVYFLDALVTAANTLQLTYGYTSFNEPLRQVTETITVADLVPSALYYRVCYYKMNTDGTLQAARNYWNYRIGAGTYPTLNTPPNSGLASPFFPIIPLRKNNTDLTHSSLSSTDLYKTSKTLLKKVGLDFLHLGESINANPDVGEVDHVFLYFGVDLQSSVAATQRYLLEFFAQLAPLSRTSYAEYLRWKKQPTTLPPQSKLTIEDAGYKADISYSYIRVRFVTGSIGKVGTVTRTNTIRDRLLWGSGFYFRYYEDSSITFRVQIASNVYKEVEVRGLTHTNYVYNRHSVITSLEDSIKDDYSFIIPLNRHVYSNLSARMRMNVANDGLKLVFQSYKVVRTKWYESGFFQFVMVTIAVVAAIFGAWQVSTAIVTASTATEVAMIILATIVKVIAISYGFKLVTDVLGAELSLIIAAVLMVYTLVSGLQQGSLKGVPYASELLSASTGLSKSASDNIAEQINDLLGDRAKAQTEQDLMWDKLESAQELLATNGIIDPMEFINTVPALQPYESPDEYYYRTVHSGNIGVLSLDAPTNYVDYMLMLPRASEPTLV